MSNHTRLQIHNRTPMSFYFTLAKRYPNTVATYYINILLRVVNMLSQKVLLHPSLNDMHMEYGMLFNLDVSQFIFKPLPPSLSSHSGEWMGW